MRKSKLLGALAASTLALTSSALLAHGDGENDELQSLVSRSDAIVYGEVIDIAYKNSEPTKNSPKGLPYTYVTYKLDRVLRGRVGSDTLTLRVPGGADGTGRIYNLSTAPLFAKGQTDVLFVGEPDESGCPLVGCVEGRFRVATEQVYNGWGVPLAAAEKSLVFGGKPRFDLNVMEVPRPGFDAVVSRPEIQKRLREMGVSTQEQLEKLRAEYEQTAPETYHIKLHVDPAERSQDYTGELKAEPMNVYPEPLGIDKFLALIEEANSHAKPPVNPVESADPKRSFTIEDPRVETLAVVDEEGGSMSEEERLDRYLESLEPDGIGRYSVR